MNMRAAWAVARFQLAGVGRRRGLWAWLALACMAASLVLPAADAGYVTSSVGTLRPLYTPELVGLTLGALGVTLMLPAHFAALRTAFPWQRHPMLLVSATPVSGATFALGRWMADCLFLSAFLLCFGIGGLFMQAVRGEAPVQQPFVLLGPVLLIGIPSASLLAGFRALVEARRFTRPPAVAAILMFLAWLIVLPLSTQVARGIGGDLMDPLGVGAPIHDLGGNKPPGEQGASFGIRISRQMDGTFQWDGFDWTGPYSAARVGWFLAGAALAVLAGLVSDRYPVGAGGKPSIAASKPVGQKPTLPGSAPLTMSPSRRLPGLIRAELRLALPGSAWVIGGMVLAFALGNLPDSPATAQRLLAVLLLLVLFRLGDIGVRATGRALLPIGGAVPMAPLQRLFAGWAAGALLVLLPTFGLLGHGLKKGHFDTATLVLLVAGALPAIALLLGRLTGSAQAFSMLGLIFCYGLFSAG